jgi:hypothetical protein
MHQLQALRRRVGSLAVGAAMVAAPLVLALPASPARADTAPVPPDVTSTV